MLEKSFPNVRNEEITNTNKKVLTPVSRRVTTIAATTTLISSALLLGGLISFLPLDVFAQVVDPSQNSCEFQENGTTQCTYSPPTSGSSHYCIGPTDEIIPCGSLSPSNPPVHCDGGGPCDSPGSIDPIPPQGVIR